MNKQTIVAVVAVAAVLLGLGAWLINQPSNPNQDSAANNTRSDIRQNDEQLVDTGQTTTSDATIIFTDEGFEKQIYKVAANQPITVINKSSISVEFSSDDHPTHRENPELNLTPLSPGAQTTFTPTREGRWKVHDHEHPEFTMTLVVES